MALTTDQVSLIVAGGALLVALVALIWSLILQRRLSRASRGSGVTFSMSDAASFSQALQAQAKTLERTATQAETLTGQVNGLLATVPHALQRVGVVRFNPFNDTGSDQSFAIALLDSRGDGLVLSALYSRGAARIYAKPVAGCRSEYTLSDAEVQAISRAMGNEKDGER